MIDSRYFVYSLLNRSGSPMWDGTRVLLPPSFAFGAAAISPNMRRRISGSPAQNIASSTDIAASLTKVRGRHTLKTGFYNQYSNKQQVQGGAAGGPALNFQQDAVGTNPCDTSFGFSNAATGCFSSYAQGSKGVEGEYIYYNIEGYVQDNWKVNRKLTLDYGVRLVHQHAAIRRARPGVEFLRRQVESRRQRRCSTSPGCANGVYPCTGTNRQAMNPLTNQFLGPNTTLAIGTHGAEHRQHDQRPDPGRQGHSHHDLHQPALGVAPRFGMAYDLSGRQQIRPARRRRLVLRSADRATLSSRRC